MGRWGLGGEGRGSQSWISLVDLRQVSRIGAKWGPSHVQGREGTKRSAVFPQQSFGVRQLFPDCSIRNVLKIYTEYYRTQSVITQNVPTYS
jgi:hypothetical protein